MTYLYNYYFLEQKNQCQINPFWHYKISVCICPKWPTITHQVKIGAHKDNFLFIKL